MPLSRAFGSSPLPFSTSEQRTADVWIDGKPIFRKVLAVAAGPNNSIVNVAHGITGLVDVVAVQGFLKNGSNLRRPIQNAEGTSTTSLKYAIDNTNLILQSGLTGDYSGYAGSVILYYTKS